MTCIHMYFEKNRCTGVHDSHVYWSIVRFESGKSRYVALDGHTLILYILYLRFCFFQNRPQIFLPAEILSLKSNTLLIAM